MSRLNKKKNKWLKNTLGLAALLALPLATNATISTTDEAVTRLDLQGQVDTRAPFSKTLWAGAHNGYSAKDWNADGDYDFQINQYYRPSDLFKRGIRLTEYDTYPVSTLSSNPELCHWGNEEDTICIVFGTDDYASLGDGLDEIENFIKDNENRDEVLLIKFEVYDSSHHNNFRNKVGDKINDRLGDLVFKPSDWGYSDGDCASLPVQKLTKADVLAAGKNVVMFTQVPRDYSEDEKAGLNLCDYHTSGKSYSKMLEFVWIGVDEMDYQGNLFSSQPMAQNGSQNSPDSVGNANASTHYENGNFSVGLDSSTAVFSWLDWLTDTSEDISIPGSDVITEAESGHNLLELALIEYDSSSDSPDIEDFVWSWGEDYPEGADSCAWSTTDHAIRDYECTTNRVHACVDEDRNWHFTTTADDWDKGFTSCSALGYDYGMPYNARENAALASAKSAASIATSVWVNYYEAIDNFWLAGSDSYEDYGYVKKDAIGSSYGDDFDSIDMLKRKLLSAGGMNVSSVQIRSGSRVDGIKICYENTQGISMASVGESEICRSYGGDGGSWGSTLSFNASNNEYLADIKVCVDDEKYGYDTVYQLTLTSSAGNAISGGTNQGSCTTYSSTSSQQVFAFHGREGSEIDALGIYKISNHLIDGGLTATGWLDRDDASSGDNETFSKHQSDGNIASNCTTADVVGYEARVVGNKLDAALSGQTVGLNETGGFYCWNSDNGGSSSNTTCFDYEVKYFFSNASCLP